MLGALLATTSPPPGEPSDPAGVRGGWAVRSLKVPGLVHGISRRCLGWNDGSRDVQSFNLKQSSFKVQVFLGSLEHANKSRVLLGTGRVAVSAAAVGRVGCVAATSLAASELQRRTHTNARRLPERPLVVVLFVCACLGLQVLLLQKLVDAATMPFLAESLA